MAWGLRLTSTRRDRAALLGLLERAPAALTADWLVVPASREPASEPDEGVYFAVSDGLRRDDALALAAQGFDVVTVGVQAGLLDVTRLRDGAHVTLDGVVPRRVSGLVAALPPRRDDTRNVVTEAVFVVEDRRATATLLERLLLLDRADARVCEVHVEGAPGPLPVARVAAPPLWLVLKHADDHEGVRVYVRSDDDGPALFVEHGFSHPLADRLSAALRERGEIGLLARDGRLTRTRAPWPERAIHDALRPELPTSTTTLQPKPLSMTFPVRMRLGAALPGDAETEPELFLLSEEALVRLQAFAEAASADELQRLFVTRVDDGSGRGAVVLREAVRAGTSRLGARLQTALQTRGFVRAVGHDGLFLVPGRRLLPVLRRDDLRALLGMEGAAAVVVDEDGDGLRVLRIPSLTDEPMSELVRYIATARRGELDRILEDAVLTFPGLSLARPRDEAHARLRDVLAAASEPDRKKRVDVQVRAYEPEPAKRPVTARVDERALKDRARVLEPHVLDAGAQDAAAWRELAEVKRALGEREDAVACASVALFLEPSQPSPTLARVVSSPSTSSMSWAALLDQQALPTTEALALAQGVLAALADGSIDDDVARRADEKVASESFAVPRRLQWAVLRALHARTGDAIGVTRAKERMLGALNARGLTEAHDLPRFVRRTLALDDGERHGAARPEQLAVVEKIVALRDAEQKQTQGRSPLVRAVVATGIARLGGDAASQLALVEHEAAERGGPVALLARLYAAHLPYVIGGTTAGSAEAWKNEVARTLQSTERSDERRVAEWLVKKSTWLRVATSVEAPLGLRPALDRLVTAASARPDVTDLAEVAEQVTRVGGCYDYEIAGALERLIELGLRSGRDDVVLRTARVAHDASASVRILAHRARLLGVVVRAAATTGDTALVERCLDDVAAIAANREVPQTRDLLLAVRPALFALRRLGELTAARRFLDAFVSLTTQTVSRETGPLAAALAEGYRALGEDELAEQMVETATAGVLSPSTPHVDRYEAGAALVGALRHWPHAERAERCVELFRALAVFRDTFTTSVWFAAHQLLMAEHLVDALVDEDTARGDRLQRWLDADEARIRRRILADWRAATA
jgi:hypothetical protein